jgi:hypothetical protein
MPQDKNQKFDEYLNAASIVEYISSPGTSPPVPSPIVGIGTSLRMFE